jgi:hypothetical protein
VSREPRLLPDPAIDPEDVLALAPGASEEQALAAARLATLMLQAAIYPRELPDPLPPNLYMAALMAAGRLARAGDPTGEVVSESLGSYSYRVQAPMPPEQALAFTEYELALIGQTWLDTGPGTTRTPTVMPFAWPIDWWQRDFDEPFRLLFGDERADAAQLAMSQEIAVR